MRPRCKVFIILMLLALAAHITGCGNSMESGNPTPAPQQQAQEEEPENVEVPLELMLTDRQGFSANAAIQTTNGDYMVVGTTTSLGHGESDVYVMRLNASGELVWENAYGTQDREAGQAIQQTREGLYIVAGGRDHYGGGVGCTYLLLIDDQGDVRWEKAYADPMAQNGLAQAVIQTADGGYALSGAGTYPSVFTANTGFVAKFDPDGELLWRKQYGGYYKNLASCHVVIENRNGDLLVTGKLGYITGYDVTLFVAELTPDGASSGKSYYWNYQISEIANALSSIDNTSDEGVILTGRVNATIDDQENGILLLKLNADLSAEWSKKLVNTPSDAGKGVKQTADGGYIIVGNTQNPDTGYAELYLIKTDSQGEIVWEKFYAGVQRATGRSITLTTGGGYLITGHTSSDETGESGIYLLVTDKDGNVE